MQLTTSASSSSSQSLIRTLCILILALANINTPAALQFGALNVINPPGQSLNSGRGPLMLVSNGSEAELVWSDRIGGAASTTNIFGSRVRPDGTLVDPAGRFLIPQFNSGSTYNLLPVGPD